MAWSSCVGNSVKPLDDLPVERLEFGSRSSFPIPGVGRAPRGREFPTSLPNPSFPLLSLRETDKNFRIIQRDKAGKGEKLCWACGKLRQEGWTCFSHSQVEFLTELGATKGCRTEMSGGQ